MAGAESNRFELGILWLVKLMGVEAGEWVELDCVVNTKNNTITATVEHLLNHHTGFLIIKPGSHRPIWGNAITKLNPIS